MPLHYWHHENTLHVYEMSLESRITGGKLQKTNGWCLLMSTYFYLAMRKPQHSHTTFEPMLKMKAY